MTEQQTITIDQLRASMTTKKGRQPKYRNQIVVVDGVTFHSKKEASQFGLLKIMEKNGTIRDLQRQVRYDFIINGHKVGHYTADMEYTDVASGNKITVDVKSPVTRLEQAYRLRVRLLKAIHGVTITEV